MDVNACGNRYFILFETDLGLKTVLLRLLYGFCMMSGSNLVCEQQKGDIIFDK